MFPKMVVPNNHGFPTKNDHFEVFWGYHHLRKHPDVIWKNLKIIWPKGSSITPAAKNAWAKASRGVCIQPHHKCPGDVVGCSGDVAIRNELSNVKNCRFYAPRCLFEKLGGMKTRCCYLKCCSYIDSPAFLTRNIIAMFVYQNCTSSVFRWSLENWVGVFRGASCIESILDWSHSNSLRILIHHSMNISCGTSCHVNISFTWATIGMKKTRGKSTAWKLCISLANHSDHFFPQNSRRTWPTRGKQSGGHSARTAAQNYGTQGLISRAGAGHCFGLFWNSVWDLACTVDWICFGIPRSSKDLHTYKFTCDRLSGFQDNQTIENEGESRSVPSISIYKRIVRKCGHSQILHLLMVNLLNLCHSVSGNAMYIWYIYIYNIYVCLHACAASIHPPTPSLRRYVHE